MVWNEGGRLPAVDALLSPHLNDPHVREAVADFAWVTLPEMAHYVEPAVHTVAQRMLTEW